MPQVKDVMDALGLVPGELSSPESDESDVAKEESPETDASEVPGEHSSGRDELEGVVVD